MPVVSDSCSCKRDCLECGRGEEPPYDWAIHVLLESMVFQERMLHGEPTEARLEEIRLVDVGALLGRSKLNEFVKLFDNLVIQGKDVLPVHKQYPVMTQKSKLVTPDV
ncbi:uncharacterized protein TNIN_199231 [Trichonephila inaurata madagascariensis]|uniref:Uncharacterized protein n=1 Tax=Trichonephila inaurata madagascariensis TaxID=2747483 RepID=A0A8X6XW93_9ARAC|nr:uncharacterized protein TNIN_199231 [Trichonephila inaurata madagascariensis]